MPVKKKTTKSKLPAKRKHQTNIIPAKKVVSTDDLFLFKCEKKVGKVRKKICGNVHFRHAGYVEMMIPYVRPDSDAKTKKEIGKIARDSFQVLVCTKCRSCYIYYEAKFWDITEHIDIKAWEKAEKELHKTTGPGGQC